MKKKSKIKNLSEPKVLPSQWQKSKLKRGFTLIEMILYIAIVSIFLTGLVYFTWDLIYGRLKSYIQQEVNQNIRFASARIIYEIRNAKSVNSPTSGSSETLSLTMSDVNRNPTIIDVANGRLRIGYGSSGTCPTSNPCYLTSNKVSLSELSFSNLTKDGSKNIKFTLTVSSFGDREELNKSETFESAVELRPD
ncbi:MAG: hypothetical protein UT39_C0018G0009 [Candidatus Woesebacteria bacterium GW2011_GWA1_39_21]|uniref:Prepilin-type N-terminal cleavage/methylation domain-containing protein n=1 Tax=Candidatus Woesebacteria bacterium GW2011_GWA1_39_21 TaxID=1618550 RepID=A0A0G0NCI9_9BACT|nr:MAG: hypothetical protein UT39_C0018G0009 [Candidatus Woesebacteria bacterium GW2011_GWA1_39_21]